MASVHNSVLSTSLLSAVQNRNQLCGESCKIVKVLNFVLNCEEITNLIPYIYLSYILLLIWSLEICFLLWIALFHKRFAVHWISNQIPHWPGSVCIPKFMFAFVLCLFCPAKIIDKVRFFWFRSWSIVWLGLLKQCSCQQPPITRRIEKNLWFTCSWSFLKPHRKIKFRDHPCIRWLHPQYER